MTIEIFCDGGARGNPGPAAVGVAAVVQGNIFKISKYIGKATNNQAEYQAVIHALRWLYENLAIFADQPRRVQLFLDSKLVVNQINGRFKVKNSDLRELLIKVRGLENQLTIPVSYLYIPREENREADRLVNKALDNI